MIKTITIASDRKKSCIDITKTVEGIIDSQSFAQGMCTIFVSHTTAAVTTGEMGEGTDKDLLEVVERFIPDMRFRHAHDPGHAWSHMASSIIGASLSIPFQNRKLLLGKWQSVLLLELDGPRQRTVVVSINQ